ncbi:MAG: hypothetical protein U9O55_04740 [Patescibacteria group bacterium]|nr:hypothetical protein [Patescibacteria group bacterium]
MKTQIFEIENQPTTTPTPTPAPAPISKIVGEVHLIFLSTVKIRGEEIRKEALRLQKENETKEISLKIFDWLKKTPDSQIGIIVSWAGYNLPASALRLKIIKGKKSKKLLIKISEIIGNSDYKLNQTWYIRSVPKKLKEKIKRALQEKLALIKNKNVSLVLSDIKFSQ